MRFSTSPLLSAVMLCAASQSAVGAMALMDLDSRQILQLEGNLLFITEPLAEQLNGFPGRECQDFCVWGGYSRGSPTRLPFVFEMQYARPDAIAGAKVEGPARSAGGSSLAPAIARREAAGALAREV